MSVSFTEVGNGGKDIDTIDTNISKVHDVCNIQDRPMHDYGVQGGDFHSR